MSLPVKTRFFAAYRDLVGIAGEEVELGDGATVRELVELLRSRGEPWSTLPERPAVAVNREYAALDEPLQPGDEVAFIPPVAGG